MYLLHDTATDTITFDFQGVSENQMSISIDTDSGIHKLF